MLASAAKADRWEEREEWEANRFHHHGNESRTRFHRGRSLWRGWGRSQWGWS